MELVRCEDHRLRVEQTEAKNGHIRLAHLVQRSPRWASVLLSHPLQCAGLFSRFGWNLGLGHYPMLVPLHRHLKTDARGPLVGNFLRIRVRSSRGHS